MKSCFTISFCLVLFVAVESLNLVSESSTLILTNNGPAVLGANVTFNASITNYFPLLPLPITFLFNDGVRSFNVETKDITVEASRTFPPDLYDEGSYCMNVSVLSPVLKTIVAENSTCFSLKRYLIGKINVHQRNDSNEEGVDEVAVGENFTASLSFYDPSGYLKGAVIDYGWSIEMHDQITVSDSVIYTFTDAGSKLILARATAVFPDSTQVFGYFSKTVLAKVPVNSVNVTGNPFLHHGDFLILNVSCNGTPPFEYCSEIFTDNVTVDNFTCRDTTSFTTCHMEIKKFLRDGKYKIGIFIGNDVREVKRVLEVMVYNVDIKPNLSTIIIPIVCSLLTLMIIAIGISFYVQQRHQLAIEVANFDFVEESDSYTGERTFFEKIFDSLACRNCGEHSQWSCSINTQNESDPLLDEQSLPSV